jgi:hypothetical protein
MTNVRQSQTAAIHFLLHLTCIFVKKLVPVSSRYSKAITNSEQVRLTCNARYLLARRITYREQAIAQRTKK